VDHCHATQRARGLLCASCNAMIGQARDSATVLRAAADYLDADAQSDDVDRLRPLVSILDGSSTGRPTRTVRFAGAVTLLIDGYIVRLAAGETKSVLSSTGECKILSEHEANEDPY
jgi:hypothetical protein